MIPPPETPSRSVPCEADSSDPRPLEPSVLIPEAWPIVHLEKEIPQWNGLVVTGAVTHRRRFSLEDLKSLGESEFRAPLHCVWGWSRPSETWRGVSMAALFRLVVPLAHYVTVESASGVYSSCLPVEKAARGWLVWHRGGSPLAPIEGGPIRFLQPPGFWAYKGVKWAAKVIVHDEFRPGFWESRVADPMGIASFPAFDGTTGSSGGCRDVGL